MSGITKNTYSHGYSNESENLLQELIYVLTGSSSASSDINVKTGGYTKKVLTTVTRPTNTDIYTAGDVIGGESAAPITFSDCAREALSTGIVVGANLSLNSNQSTKGDFELWLFEDYVTCPGDNAPVTFTDSDIQSLVGIIQFKQADVKVGLPGAGASGNCGYPGTLQNPMAFKCKLTAAPSGTSKELYGVLIVRNAYTPIADEEFNIFLHIAQD